jgi:hypothetical protein
MFGRAKLILTRLRASRRWPCIHCLFWCMVVPIVSDLVQLEGSILFVRRLIGDDEVSPVDCRISFIIGLLRGFSHSFVARKPTMRNMWEAATLQSLTILLLRPVRRLVIPKALKSYVEKYVEGPFPRLVLVQTCKWFMQITVVEFIFIKGGLCLQRPNTWGRTTP